MWHICETHDQRSCYAPKLCSVWQPTFWQLTKEIPLWRKSTHSTYCMLGESTTYNDVRLYISTLESWISLSVHRKRLRMNMTVVATADKERPNHATASIWLRLQPQFDIHCHCKSETKAELIFWWSTTTLYYILSWTWTWLNSTHYCQNICNLQVKWLIVKTIWSG